MQALTWTDRARQATAYRNGHVLLAGAAMNLGWKLAATIQGKVPEGLLDSYQTERRPFGEQVLDWSRAQVALMKPDPDAHALNAIVRDLMNTRDGATYIAGGVWGVFTHYHLGDDHPLVSHSVPNFEFEDGARIGELMHDGQRILLDFDKDAALKTLASEYGDRMKYVCGRAKEQFALSVVLIRPDGITAWASDNHPDCRELQKAAARWLVRRDKWC